MTNKIIAGLALGVVALLYLAVNLWSEDEVTDGLLPQKASQQEISSEAEKEVAIAEKQDVPSPEDSTPETIEPKVTQDSEPDKEVCQLANQYNDWYPSGNKGYESAAFMDEVKAWAATRGYFETEYSKGGLDVKKRSDYDYYALEDLEEMAGAGDSMANVRLAYRLYLKGDSESMERAQPYCNRAIIDGYTGLVMCKTSYLLMQVYEERAKEGDEADVDKQKQLETDLRAWSDVVSELGDTLGAEISKNMLVDTEHEITQETVKQRSEELKNSILQQRKELGIGDIEYPKTPELLMYVLNNTENIQEEINACFK